MHLFAGEIRFAEQVMKELDFTSSEFEICNSLLSNHIQSRHVTEYLIVSGSEMKMWNIKNGSCELTTNSWIGSSNAFRRYQGYLLEKIPQENNHGVSIFIESVSDNEEPVFKSMSNVSMR